MEIYKLNLIGQHEMMDYFVPVRTRKCRMEDNLTLEKGKPSHYNLMTRMKRQLHSVILSPRWLAASFDKNRHTIYKSFILVKCMGLSVIFTIQRLLMANGTNILKRLGKKKPWIHLCLHLSNLQKIVQCFGASLLLLYTGP